MKNIYSTKNVISPSRLTLFLVIPLGIALTFLLAANPLSYAQSENSAPDAPTMLYISQGEEIGEEIDPTPPETSPPPPENEGGPSSPEPPPPPPGDEGGSSSSADLIFTSLDINPSTSTVGQTITVSAVYSNIGGEDTGGEFSIKMRAYIQGTPLAYGIEVFDFGPLAAGGSSSVSFDIPGNEITAAGEYTIVFMIDQQFEIDEGNNEGNNAIAGHIYVKTKPDLRFSENTLTITPSPSVSGQSVDVSVAYENIGESTTNWDGSDGMFRIKLDVIQNGTGTTIEESGLLGPLIVGEAATINFTIPSSQLAVGNCTVFLEIDSQGDISEDSETNNTIDRNSRVNGKSDLIFTEGTLVIDPSSSVDGQSVDVSVAYENIGENATNWDGTYGTFRIKLDVIQNGTRTTIEESGLLGPLSSDEAATINFTIPSSQLAVGNATVFLEIDSQSVIDEDTKDNNTIDGALFVKTKPDLVFTSLTFESPVFEGELISVTSQYINQGGSPTDWDGDGVTFTIRTEVEDEGYNLSYETVSYPLDALRPQETGTFQMNIPPDALSGGNYMVKLRIDYNDAVDESDEAETNNAISRPLNVLRLPEFDVDPNTVDFNIAEDDTDGEIKTVDVKNTAGGEVAYWRVTRINYGSDPEGDAGIQQEGWIVEPRIGNGGGVLSAGAIEQQVINVDISVIDGDYGAFQEGDSANAYITFIGYDANGALINGSPQVVRVSLEVTAPIIPIFVVTPNELNFSLPENDETGSDTRQVLIRNIGGGSINSWEITDIHYYAVSTNTTYTGWITTPRIQDLGSVPSTDEVRVDISGIGIPEGANLYADIIYEAGGVSVSGSPQVVRVNLVVTAPIPIFDITPNELNFSLREDDETGSDPQQVRISNIGGGFIYPWEITDIQYYAVSTNTTYTGWITTPRIQDMGSVPSTDEVRVDISGIGIPEGANPYADIIYEAGGASVSGSPQVVRVNLTVIEPINEPPYWSAYNDDEVISEGQALNKQLSEAIDPDGDPLTYTLYNNSAGSGQWSRELPAGLIFNANSRTLDWTPDFSQAGEYSFLYRATDPSGENCEDPFTITVIDAMPDLRISRPDSSDDFILRGDSGSRSLYNDFTGEYEVFLGETVLANVRLRNSGSGPANPSQVGVYANLDSAPGTTDSYRKAISSPIPLSPGREVSLNDELILRPNETGLFHVKFKADCLDVVDEGTEAETNNVTRTILLRVLESLEPPDDPLGTPNPGDERQDEWQPGDDA